MSGPATAFPDPVHDAQRVFRLLLDAFAHPGTVVRTATAVTTPPLGPATSAILLTVADQDTPVWLSPAFATQAVRDFLAFHCGAPIVNDPLDAMFAVQDARGGEPLEPRLDAYAIGSELYPDRSCTVLLEVSSLTDGLPKWAAGPGIANRIAIAPRIHSDFWTHWRENHALFPCGCDVVLAAQDAWFALPRTTDVADHGDD
ncbi:MAG: phosphonate C-P lyase system protein PhnH [Pseudomonadota bacterium]